MTGLWRKCELGDVLTLQRGFDLPSQDRKEGKYPIVSSSGVTGFHSEFKADGPGVVTGRYGTIGQFFYLTEKYWPLNTTLYVKDFKGSEPQFIYYFLHCLNIKDMNAAGAVPGVNRNHLHKIKVRLPPLPIQKNIAGVLSAYDDLIGANLKRIKLFEEMAQITYEEWFVRRRFPGHENTPTNPETDLPEGWAQTPIGEKYKTGSGGTPSRKHEELYYTNGTIPWIRTQELRNKLITESLVKITPSGLKNSSAKMFPKNTVLLAMYGNTIGEVGFLRFPACTNQACCAFLTEEYQSYFIYQFLKINKKLVLAYRMGAAQENISQEIIKVIKILDPGDALLREYGDIVRPIFDKVENLLKQNALLKQARDLLLPRLMTGLIDIDDYLAQGRAVVAAA